MRSWSDASHRTRLIRENKLVVLENLNVSGQRVRADRRLTTTGMRSIRVKNRKLARAISQQGWSTFRTMCEAKTNQYLGREIRVIDKCLTFFC